ncbi:MAG: UDP-2,3-diacylglucosamine diphosphatase [Neisseria sp.]|jgi:UDP-2,3-diacylglucosamine hydrolase|uniref:UDP-2,3-diacylglucosamine hydrolase n=1 Tax=Neisseria oralis TaxID=1107316 RepID=A0ABW8Q2J3_9NEIS
MTVYFIADLHLSEARPDLTELFLHFMYGEAEKAQAVYILGDLFDFWIGDDERSVLTDTVKQAIRHLTGRGVKCYFIHGNRDFLLGKRFAAETGMILLPEYQTVDLFGRKTLICHGDTLCTDDVRYQQFRRKVHQKWRQKLFLLLPLPLRVSIAKKIRQTSKQDKQRKAAEIMDVNPQTVAETVGRYGADLLIHGHTHRQNIHRNDGFTRIVLGDWKKDQASILKIDEHGFGFI